MSQLATLIVDDETRSRNIMDKMLRSYCPQVRVVGQAASVEEAETLFHQLHPQLLLLDIEMPYGSGFELLRRLARAAL